MRHYVTERSTRAAGGSSREHTLEEVEASMSSTTEVTAENKATGSRRWTGGPGFTLVEMLIGIVVTGVVGAALVGVLRNQQVFYQENSRRVMAQKSLRQVADRMSAELRMVRKGDVVTAESDRLVTRHGETLGVVCDTASGTVYLYLHRLPDSSPETMRYLEPRYQGSWQSAPSWSDVDVDGTEHCAISGSPPGKPEEQYRKVSSWSTPLPGIGTQVYGTSRLTYEFVQQSNGEVVLQRNGDHWTGPFAASGVYFRYFQENGTELTAPVTGSSLDDIAWVRVGATAQGHDPSPARDGEQRISLRVPFRN